MALSGLHTNWFRGSYTSDRDYEIKLFENAPMLVNNNLSKLNTHDDGNTSIAIGYGYDLNKNLATLKTDLASFVTAGSDLNKVYDLVNEYFNQGNPKHFTTRNALAVEINKYLDLGTEASAAALLTQTVNKFETQLDTRLGYQMPQSRERAVLVSMAYNGGGGTNLIGAKLKAAIVNDNRSEAWFEIRYNSNGGTSENQGLANRRYNESNLFGLYDSNMPLDASEAFKETMRMYTWGKDLITQYEKDYPPSSAGFAKIDENIKPARDYLVSNFAMGKTIDGEVIVGAGLASYAYMDAGHINDNLTGTDKNDLIFGEKGDDRITGGKGTDVLIGGEGNDTLDGNDGAGGDILEGGTGIDTYYADDGDTIRDSDGKGVIYLNGKRLSSATRKKGETIYLDGSGNSFIRLGSQLMVNDPLIIQGFDNGELGVTLDEYDPDDPLKKAFEDAERTKSPIVLDLDGNGIATRGVAEGTFFDYDGNGFAERTGWATSGDGLLVRDLDANGTINNGSELFGDYTKLKDGQTAANGYAAMADLDDNLDGKLDSQDAAWNELKIWQDLDSNGITETGELKTLEESGVQSINTGYINITNIDSQGNQHLQQGNFTKADGSTGLAEDIWFNVDLSSTRNENPLELTEAIIAMPEISGRGNVASLRQVMAQQAVNGNNRLQSLVEQFTTESDPVARNALTIRIIYEWSGVTDKDPFSRAATIFYGNAIGDARKLYAMEALLGEGYEGTWCWGEKDPNPHGPASAILLKAFDEFANGIAVQLMQQTQFKNFYDAIAYTWDETTQTVTGDLSGTLPIIAASLAADREQSKSQLAEFITSLANANNVNIFNILSFQEALGAYGQDVVSIAGLAWRGMIATQGNDQLRGDATDEIIAGKGGNDVMYGGGGNDQLLGEEGSDTLYGQDGNDMLDGGAGNDLLYGGTGNDTFIFGRSSGHDTIWDHDDTIGKRDILKLGAGITADDIDLIRNIDDLVITIRDTGDRITVAGYFVNDGVSSTSLEAIEFENGLVWDFNALKDMLPSMGTEGDDRIRGYYSAEAIDGLGGDDVIEGQGGDDLLRGAAGNDMVYGGTGNDSLDGGAGNDVLRGGGGNDIYLFNLGDGQDTIHDSDTTAGNLDTIRFGAGVSASDITFTRNGNDLLLGINGTSDQLRIQNWGNGDTYRIERMEFADGTTWDVATIRNQIPAVTTGTNGNDYLQSWTGLNDTLLGMGGNDTLYGSSGNDTYLFNRGDGQDTISDYDYTSGNLDTIRFGEGIGTNDLTFARNGNDLIVGVTNTSDQLRIQNWGYGDAFRIERMEFADGTTWDTAIIQTQISGIKGTDGNDYLQSWIGLNDTLLGMGGNDTLYGSSGNDTLDGGTGNDYMSGNAGNDTYLFNLGDGQDVIYDYDGAGNQADMVVFGDGITPEGVEYLKVGNDLKIAIKGSTDSLTIQNFFNSTYH